MSKHAYMGIDMGGTHTRLCILDEQRNIIELDKMPTEKVVEVGLVRGLSQLIKAFIVRYDLNLHRIIIGLPATISKDRKKVLSTPNLTVNNTEFNSLVPHLQEMFSCPVELERDVNLQIAYDTDHLNIANKLVLGCYLGTGFGFSIWINGDVYTGAHGVAGELGHIPFGDDSKTCGCGNKGCLETVVSGVQLKAEYERQNAKYQITSFFEQDCNKEFVSRFINKLAKSIATSINLFDPDVVIFGGGVMDMESFPYTELKRETLARTRGPLPRESLVFMPAPSSSFNGASGAAIQALNRTR
ncbi:allose kinase [Vibrio sp. SA48]